MPIPSVLPLRPALAALVLVAAGCGGGGGGSGSNAVPSAASAAAAESAAALAAAEGSETAATDAIVDSGTAPGQSAARNAGALEPSFAWTGSGTRSVDLDATDDQGRDRYPNATGTCTVTWSGDVVTSQPTGSSGMAAYSVTVSYDTACVFSDPRSGAQAQVAAGSTRDFQLSLDWTRTDANTWSLDSATHLALNGWSVQVTRGGSTRSVALSGQRDATARVVRDAGPVAVTRDVVSLWNATVAGPGGSHEVVWDRDALDVIRITVDGRTYGPYTRAQVRELWRLHVD